ncbi:10569_t:CDS:2, partial [Cetraspora pellucida]
TNITNQKEKNDNSNTSARAEALGSKKRKRLEEEKLLNNIRKVLKIQHTNFMEEGKTPHSSLTKTSPSTPKNHIETVSGQPKASPPTKPKENWEDETEDEIEQQSSASFTRSSSEASKISPAIPTETVSNITPTDNLQNTTYDSGSSSVTQTPKENNPHGEDGHTTYLKTLMQEEKSQETTTPHEDNIANMETDNTQQDLTFENNRSAPYTSQSRTQNLN